MRAGPRACLLLAALVVIVAGSGEAEAVTAKSWSASSARELSAGTLDGTTLDEEGQVRLALETETLWGPEQGIVWAVAADEAGGVFVALSSPGRLLHVAANAAALQLHELGDESLVAALTADGEGGVLYGVSPEGRVYRAALTGESRVEAETGALFVWGLATDGDGTAWIATGMPGMLLRHRSGSSPETVFESGDDPVRCVIVTSSGEPVLGTGGEGRVVRIGEDDRAFVLFDAEEAEIVALAEGEDGSIFALTARGSKQIAAAKASQTAANETVRVVATAPSPENGERDSESKPPTRKPSTSPMRIKTPPGGALYRIHPELGAQRIWQTANEVPFALATTGGKLLVATGDAGRVHVLDARGRSSRLLDVASEQASALAVAADGRVLVGGTTDARVMRLGPGLQGAGVYLTRPIDAGTTADWGRLGWEADVPSGARMRVSVRAGNTDTPDETWTEWSGLDDERDAAGQTAVPRTRWLQARVEMAPSRSDASPTLRGLELFFVPQNRSPKITDLTLQPAGVVWSPGPTQASARRGPIVADDPVARKMSTVLRGKSAAPAVRKAYELGARTVNWKAEDPDEDVLTYRVEIRREGTEVWIPLALDHAASFLSWDARGLPDGTYRVRLTAYDRKDNPEDRQYSDTEVSAAFRIDNTRPTVGRPSIRQSGDRIEVRFTASDPGGNVAAVEVAVDGGEWAPLEPLDGVADSQEERYELEIGGEPAPETRTLRVRVTDSSGNLGGDAWPIE